MLKAKSSSNQVYGIKKLEKVRKGSGVVTQVRQDRLSWVVIFLLVTLISFNVILFFKLWRLDDESHEINSTPKTNAEWFKIVKLQDKMHVKEMIKWQDFIGNAVDLLKKV